MKKIRKVEESTDTIKNNYRIIYEHIISRGNVYTHIIDGPSSSIYQLASQFINKVLPVDITELKGNGWSYGLDVYRKTFKIYTYDKSEKEAKLIFINFLEDQEKILSDEIAKSFCVCPKFNILPWLINIMNPEIEKNTVYDRTIEMVSELVYLVDSCSHATRQEY